jgi:hypothetical protein
MILLVVVVGDDFAFSVVACLMHMVQVPSFDLYNMCICLFRRCVVGTHVMVVGWISRGSWFVVRLNSILKRGILNFVFFFFHIKRGNRIPLVSQQRIFEFQCDPDAFLLAGCAPYGSNTYIPTHIHNIQFGGKHRNHDAQKV